MCIRDRKRNPGSKTASVSQSKSKGLLTISLLSSDECAVNENKAKQFVTYLSQDQKFTPSIIVDVIKTS